MTGRTRLGKVIGSAPKLNSEGWTIQPDVGRGWLLIAPSGAHWQTFRTEQDARAACDDANEVWFSDE